MRVTCIVVLALLAVGCSGGDVGRDDYVRENRTVLHSIPPPPSGSLTEQVSRPYTGRDVEGADIIGYWTIRTYATPRGLTAEEVIRFYRQRLGPEWELLQQSAAPSLSYRKGDAYLHILADEENVVVEVDHDCFKGGPAPRCG